MEIHEKKIFYRLPFWMDWKTFNSAFQKTRSELLKETKK